MKREDSKPWYRQFWPWFIIAIPAFAVVAGLTTVWIAMQSTDSLVVQSADGVRNASDRRISAERLAAELGLAAVVAINPDTGVVTAVMRSGDLDTVPATLDFELSHPTHLSRDAAITLNKAMPDADGNPVWVGHLLTIPEGRYYAVLRAGETWRLTAEWRGEESLTLRSGSDDSG